MGHHNIQFPIPIEVAYGHTFRLRIGRKIYFCSKRAGTDRARSAGISVNRNCIRAAVGDHNIRFAVTINIADRCSIRKSPRSKINARIKVDAAGHIAAVVVCREEGIWRKSREGTTTYIIHSYGHKGSPARHAHTQ